MAEPLVCAWCGAVGPGEDHPGAALTWTREADRTGRTRAYCPACARDHLRSIEAKLDDRYW